jgi:glycosyltransferase involved in cell wall biosynthesis
MNNKISAVINTLNEEKNIEQAIKSVSWADEIIVCDMYSEDKTREIAKKMGAKVVLHKKINYVEPARNFAISKASYDWVLVLDADEEIPDTLSGKLKQIVSGDTQLTFVEIPRKNIIFGQWMKASMWWPDYQPRFFRKGNVIWSNKIHSKPETSGQGLKLPAEEGMTIIHHHYTSVFQFIERLNRYSSIQAEELKSEGVKFEWVDLLNKPWGEFLSRYFANQGFKDGLHGLALSLLQAFSFVIVYLKLWEMENFQPQKIESSEIKRLSQKAGEEINYWFKYGDMPKDSFKKLLQRIKNRFL